MTQSNALFAYVLLASLGALIDPMGYDAPSDQDLIDRTDPEDAMHYVDSNLVAAGLEESHYQPLHGYDGIHMDILWHTDGEDARFEMN